MKIILNMIVFVIDVCVGYKFDFIIELIVVFEDVINRNIWNYMLVE